MVNSIGNEGVGGPNEPLGDGSSTGAITSKLSSQLSELSGIATQIKGGIDPTNSGITHSIPELQTLLTNISNLCTQYESCAGVPPDLVDEAQSISRVATNLGHLFSNYSTGDQSTNIFANPPSGNYDVRDLTDIFLQSLITPVKNLIGGHSTPSPTAEHPVSNYLMNSPLLDHKWPDKRFNIADQVNGFKAAMSEELFKTLNMNPGIFLDQVNTAFSSGSLKELASSINWISDIPDDMLEDTALMTSLNQMQSDTSIFGDLYAKLFSGSDAPANLVNMLEALAAFEKDVGVH